MRTGLRSHLDRDGRARLQDEWTARTTSAMTLRSMRTQARSAARACCFSSRASPRSVSSWCVSRLRRAEGATPLPVVHTSPRGFRELTCLCDCTFYLTVRLWYASLLLSVLRDGALTDPAVMLHRPRRLQWHHYRTTRVALSASITHADDASVTSYRARTSRCARRTAARVSIQQLMDPTPDAPLRTVHRPPKSLNAQAYFHHLDSLQIGTMVAILEIGAFCALVHPGKIGAAISR